MIKHVYLLDADWVKSYNGWRTGLVMCLLHQAKTICSNEFYFRREVSKLQEMFFNNGYPNSFFEKTFQKFKDKLNSSALSLSDDDVEKVNLVIPYVGEASHKFAKQMTSLFRDTYNVKLCPVFKSCKIGDYFSLKCGTPFPYSANVVYQFNCLRDAGCSYIGQTKRHLLTRVTEHLSIDKPSGSKSEIKNHIYKCPVCHKKFLNIENFKILKRCKFNYDCRILEALTIKKLRPKLNKQLFRGGASYLLKVF